MITTITSLAILKVNSDYLRKDYVENFVPFIATLIGQKNYEQIEVNRIRQDFTEEYGLVIPYHAMITILNRARKRGLIRGKKWPIVPVKEKVAQFEFSGVAKQQVRKQDRVIDQFVDFARRIYNVELTKEDARSAFISFLKEHDLEILFAAQESTVLPSAKSSTRGKFLIHSFVKHTFESAHETFQFIVDIAIGHILASTLLYRELDRFQGNLRGVSFYLDTRFILRLLGLEGEERKAACLDFLKSMTTQGASLLVFAHTYEETMGVLEDCLKWVENPLYDASLAGPALRYLVENNYKSSDLDRLMVNVPRVLEENAIKIEEAPDANKYRFYQIDEKKLRATIVKTYKESGSPFDVSEKERTIQKDIKSISAVNKHRKGRNPRLIKQARAIFVTTNCSLAYANSRFELLERGSGFRIPACLTDVFTGTLVWLQSPAKVSHVNEKKILGDCYAALQPDRVIIKKYLNEIEKLRAGTTITENEYYMLRTHKVAMNLLQVKTMGDPGAFTDRTPQEILEEIRAESRSEEKRKRLQEEQRHRETIAQLRAVTEDKEVLAAGIQEVVGKICRVIGWAFFALVASVFVIGMVGQFFPNLLPGDKLRVATVVAFFLTIIGVAYGSNIKGMRDKIETSVRAKILQRLRRVRTQRQTDEM